MKLRHAVQLQEWDGIKMEHKFFDMLRPLYKLAEKYDSEIDIEKIRLRIVRGDKEELGLLMEYGEDKDHPDYDWRSDGREIEDMENDSDNGQTEVHRHRHDSSFKPASGEHNSCCKRTGCDSCGGSQSDRHITTGSIDERSVGVSEEQSRYLRRHTEDNPSVHHSREAKASLPPAVRDAFWNYVRQRKTGTKS